MKTPVTYLLPTQILSKYSFQKVYILDVWHITALFGNIMPMEHNYGRWPLQL